MYSENPLCLVVLGILKNTNDPIGIYDLMKRIEDAGYSLVSSNEAANDTGTQSSTELKLFKKNFVLMNALYQIKHSLVDSGFNLYISSLNIFLAADEPSECQALSSEIVANDVSSDPSLSEFYLDWGNYRDTDENAVEKLLSSFWKRFTEYNILSGDLDKRSRALQTLGVESNASWENIKQAYRNKIAIYHPDKGGTSAQFIEIREAYQFLYLMKRSNN